MIELKAWFLYRTSSILLNILWSIRKRTDEPFMVKLFKHLFDMNNKNKWVMFRTGL